MINIRMQQQEVQKLSPKITVVGVGGAGGNAVNNMIGSGLEGCEFLVCNTDAQALEGSLCEDRIQLGVTVTSGLGAGAKPDIGRAAAEESLDEVMQYLDGANMAFITAGMGGGSGTGGAPVIAKHCREQGILTVGVVTKPFHFEGSLRMKMAEQGIEEMQSYVDTLIVIPNQNLFRVANEKTTFAEAFKMADGVLQSAVRGVTDLMVRPGLINLDFADIRSVMLEMGKAMMGTGEAEGERRAEAAAEAAINNPLLDDVSMKGARGVIINVTGGDDMTLFEVDEACNRIRDEVDPNANIIIGSTTDAALDGTMRVSVVATGIDAAEAKGKTRFSGGASVSAVSSAPSQEPKLERAQPNMGAVVAAQSPLLETVGTLQQGLMDSNPIVSAPSQPVVENNEALAYQQQASQAVAGTATPSGTLPRGTVFRDSFIPPKPLMPHEEIVASAPEVAPVSDVAVAPPVANLSATRTQAVQEPAQTVSSPSLSLRPPVPGARAQQNTEQKKQRTPSLFERFTSPIRQHLGVDSHAVQRQESLPAATGANTGPMGLKPAAAIMPDSQGRLNISAPSAPRQEAQPASGGEDELDIPAFLRRQAN